MYLYVPYGSHNKQGIFPKQHQPADLCNGERCEQKCYILINKIPYLEG
jgi:hypothetical protein